MANTADRNDLNNNAQSESDDISEQFLGINTDNTKKVVEPEAAEKNDDKALVVKEKQNKELASADGAVNANRIRFIDRMNKSTQLDIRSRANGLLGEFTKNENLLNHFGDRTMTKVNSIVDKSLDKTNNKMDYKEINDIVRNMTGMFDERIKDYEKNSSSFDVVKKDSSGIPAFFNRLFNRTKEYNFDSKPLLERFDIVEKKLRINNTTLENNIKWGNDLTEANNESIDNLIKVIALLEAVRDEAEVRVEELDGKKAATDIGDPMWHRIEDERATVANVIHDIDTKHSEYVVRLFDAYSTNAQIRNVIAISQSVGQKSNQVVSSVIPGMKQVIHQIETTIDARKSAELIDNIQGASEDLRELQARTAVENTKYVMQISESPTESAESIMKTAQALVQSNNEFIAAIEEGTRKREEVEHAVMSGVKLINESVRDRDTRIVDAMLGSVGSKPYEAIDNVEDHLAELQVAEEKNNVDSSQNESNDSDE